MGLLFLCKNFPCEHPSRERKKTYRSSPSQTSVWLLAFSNVLAKCWSWRNFRCLQLINLRPSTLKTKFLKDEEMKLDIQVSCSESLCIVAGDPEGQTHVPVHRPGRVVGEVVLRNTIVMYRNEKTPWTSITGVFVAIFFWDASFLQRQWGGRDLILNSAEGVALSCVNSDNSGTNGSFFFEHMSLFTPRWYLFSM